MTRFTTWMIWKQPDFFLASIGHLDSEDMIYIEEIDLTCSPINIVNCLAKRIQGMLLFKKVSGLCFEVLENINCWKLDLFDLELSTSDPEEPSSIVQHINVSEMVYMSKISGDKKGLLDRITCDSLELYQTSLDIRETMSLTEMFKNRVRYFKIAIDDDASLDYQQITNYDGKGRCENIILDYLYEKDIKDYLESWAGSVGWTVMEEDELGFGETSLILLRSNLTDWQIDPMILEELRNIGITFD